MQTSLYWDDFKRRINETIIGIKNNTKIPVRRLAVFITDKCNFNCSYCNMSCGNKELPQDIFDKAVNKYKNAIIHITGGEPSCIRWLYDYIESHENIRFHLNSNCYRTPPKNIKRLKVSLDSQYYEYFDRLVGVRGAHKKVVENIKRACNYTIVSITCTLTRENYTESHKFMDWCRNEFPNLYAVFFSVYKGNNPRFKFDKFSANEFFYNYKPKLESVMDNESYRLLQETIDEKHRIMEGIRFPENKCNLCYISMSERVIDWTGEIYNCSHLYRDNIKHTDNNKHEKCLYGCNRRLVKFNEEVYEKLNKD